MCLITTVIASIASTLLWYFCDKRALYRLGILPCIFWGASVMWFVDAVFEYAQLGAEFFNQAPADLLNDSILGLCAVILGICAWLAVLLFKDPKGAFEKLLKK